MEDINTSKPEKTEDFLRMFLALLDECRCVKEAQEKTKALLDENLLEQKLSQGCSDARKESRRVRRKDESKILREVSVVRVIKVSYVTGKTDSSANPLRLVTQYNDESGRFLAEFDPINLQEKQ